VRRGRSPTRRCSRSNTTGRSPASSSTPRSSTPSTGRRAAHLIEDGGHHRITIDPAAHNHQAIRAYEKAGFTRVGIMRRYERDMATGEWHDGLLMELVGL
jgi:hypothetical protein